MRLTLSEITKIIHQKNIIFGNDSKIFLFGSRLDDTKKGGDIDLYIHANANDIFNKKINFISSLHKILGEQKIDVIFAQDPARSIEKQAIKEGVELNLDKIKLQKYFNECDKHLQRIEEAYEDVENLIPLDANSYKNLDKHAVQAFDQYLFRFAKLQDTMGDKIFPLIVQAYEQNTQPQPFIDILNKLEKFGLLNSTKEWLNLRQIRNIIAHQYDDEAQEMSQAINNIINQKEIIKSIYLKIKENKG